MKLINEFKTKINMKTIIIYIIDYEARIIYGIIQKQSAKR